MKKIILLLAIVPFLFISCTQKGGSKRNSNVISNAKEKLGDQKFLQFSKLIFDAATKGINGKVIPAYQNDSLTLLLTAEEILKRGLVEQAVQIPMDKNDPTAPIIDSIIAIPLDPGKDINNFRIVQIITELKEKLKYSAEIVGMSLTFKFTIPGANSFNDVPLFWVKFSDLKTVLDEKSYNELVDACIP
jgi:hypothetical protein